MKEKGIMRLVKRNIAISLLLGFFLNTLTFADELIKTRDGSTARVITAPNGTKMIELVNPNNSGISVNDFDRLSVDEKNLILNNISPKEGTGYRSELGGIIAPNENYTGNPARAVLIRVHKDPSVINGFIEAASTNRIDMIFSNPQGLYLNGGMVGRFGNVTFTTGRVSDDLMTIMVRDGRIEIGSGFNGDAAESLNLLARSIQINGQLNGNDLTLIGGQYDYNTGTKEIIKQGTNSGEVLVSASIVGSVYGRNIYLKAVDGDLAVKGSLVSEKVLSLNADGTITTERNQGLEKVEIKAKEFTQNTSTYSEGNIKIEADKVTLNGSGTQGNNIDITGTLNNNSNLYAKGNVTVGNSVKSAGQLISEKNLNINGNLDTSNIVYGKENINISGYLFNLSDIQSEGNIIVGGNTTNKGKIFSDNILQINGITLNEGTLYGKNNIKLQNLTNSGNIQTAGGLTSKNTKNTGKIIAEGNITVLDLDNQSELITNKILTTNNLTNTGTLSTGEGITSNGNVINYGELKTNGNFSILGNLNNHNLLNAGGLLSTKDLINYGNLKAVEKILTNGTTFYNQGEILTTNLDVNNTNILNTNKITVIETAKLNGSSVVNQGQLSGTNIDLTTSVLTNSNQIIADGIITAQNTTLNNTGYIGSNGKIILNGSNISNQGSLESNIIEMYNLFAYNNNGGSIKGNGVYLSTLGNVDLRGILHGESDLRVSAYDIYHNDVITGTGYMELKGHDITNNTELASGSIVIEGTGNIINNSIITGKNGSITGYNIINNDLIAFSEQLRITATDKITNNAGKAIFAGELLSINFNTLENLGGELLSQGSMSLTGNYLLNKVTKDSHGISHKASIEATDDIELNVDKIDNIGEVTGLNDYEIYYETWDGKIYTEAEFNATWEYLAGHEEAGSNGGRVNHFNSMLSKANAKGGYNSLLDYYYGTEIRNRFVTDGEYGAVVSDTQMYPGVAIKGKIKSNAQTTYANISSGKDLLIRGKNGGSSNELNNMDGKISAKETAELNVTTITNKTSVSSAINLSDGYEEVSWWGIDSGRRPVKYNRKIKAGDTAYSSGQLSVIEAGNLIINTGNLILSQEFAPELQKIDGSTTSGITVGGKNTKTGQTNSSGLIVVEKNISPILEIKTTGILAINPLGAQSSLFGYSKDPTSKYLLETRSKYINLGDFYGSDYYLSKIGYDESSDWNRARRLGDSYYEYLLVTRAISDKLGTRFINGLSDKELMKSMLDNSVELQKDLQLSVGVALTPDQVKALKSDVIWYEYEVVNGENVLVPKVYLSQTTLATIEVDGRDRIGGLNLTAITADELRNNGQVIGNGGVTYVNAGKVYNVTDTNQLSEIRGDKVAITATAGNIENIGGKIKAKESLSLTAENGDIINSSSIRTSVLNKGELHRSETDHILSVGSIESEGTTYVEGKNYISEAGSISGKTTVIKAEENILIGSASLSGEDKFGENKDNYQYYKGTQKVGSEVSGTDNVILESGNKIDISGSTVASDGTVQITAKDINIVNEKENTYLESKSKYKSTFESTESESKRSNEYAQGSTVIGKNVILDAEKDINIRSSTIGAFKDEEGTGGNISVTAGNDINILAETLDNSYYSKMKTKKISVNASSGGGSATAGVNYSKNSLEQEGSSTVVSTSTLISEGSTVLDAGNKIKTEAIQADIGENLVIKGKNGVEMLDAQEVYEDKVKQKSTSIGVSLNVGFTPAQLANTVSDVSKNAKDYGFDNPSQTINTLGNGLQDLRNVSGLTQNMRNWYGGNGYISTKDIIQNGNIAPDNLRNAAKGMVSASVTASYSQSKYESNTSGTNSVAGRIDVGKNFILQSENGDVTLVNQKINVGENFVVDANNFTVKAGENTYKNDTKSSSTGANIGYDIVNNQVMGGANVSGGKSNTSSKTYENSIINVGGTFQLTTREDALFAGVNVNADKINFDIGRDLSIISLQDEYKSDGKNWGVGLNVSGKIPGTEKQGGYARPTGSVNYGENHQDSKWTGNQTTILAETGGNIKVGETLTNVGSIIGSLSDSNKLSIEANKVVVENLKDHNEGSNFGLSMGGIGLGTKDQGNTTPVGQTGLQYGSHDKQQDSNATFVNTEVTEAGKKLNLEEMGINTDISKAQVVTKDEVVEQIDTVLHTDLLNKSTRDQVIKDINGLINTPGDIIKAINIANNNEDSNFLDNLVGTIRSTDSDMNNTLTMGKKYKELNSRTDLSAEEKASQALILANQSANGMRENFGIDNDVPILVLFADESKGDEAGAFLREDGMMVIFLDPSKIDMSDSKQVYNGLMYEMNHYNPSNPYVYDKKEGEVNKGTTLHDQEEGFTSIGRKEITGEGNKFYDEVLKGSNVLTAGNNVYGTIEEEQLDYWDIIEGAGKAWNKVKKPIGSGINYLGEKAGQGVSGVGNLVGNSAETLGKGFGTVVKVFDENTGKKITTGSKNAGSDKTKSDNTSKKITDTTTKIANTIKNVDLENNKIVQQTDEYRNKYNGISTVDLGLAAIVTTQNPNLKEKVESGLGLINSGSFIEHRVVEDPTQWGPWLAIGGQGLIETREPKLVALGLAAQGVGGLINIGKGSSEIAKGNIEGGLQDIGSGILFLGGAYYQQQGFKTGLSQTTATSNKGLTPEKYYNMQNKVGMTPEVAEVVNKNYGTNYIPTVVQENKTLYNNLGIRQEPYNGPRETPILKDGKYKDSKTGFTIKGDYTYVIDENGSLQMAKSTKLGMGGGHTSLSGGQPVKYAGTMRFSNGKLIFWDNGSGHYEPSASQAPEISKILKSLGLTDATMNTFEPAIIKSTPLKPQ